MPPIAMLDGPMCDLGYILLMGEVTCSPHLMVRITVTMTPNECFVVAAIYMYIMLSVFFWLLQHSVRTSMADDDGCHHEFPPFNMQQAICCQCSILLFYETVTRTISFQ